MHKITQNILLFNKEGHILLLKHKAGKWLLPGGRLNDGARLPQGPCLARGAGVQIV